jgi:hypothetical protein
MSDLTWTVDSQGQRVMLGLTADETAEYQSLLNVSAGVSCEEMLARFASLQRRHQASLDSCGFESSSENGRDAGMRPEKAP